MAETRSFVCWQPRRQAAVRLLCFPYAGGGPAVFRRWHDRLPEDVEVWSVALPGRAHRLSEPPARCLRSLVDALVTAIEPDDDRPLALFGHSMGALLAFEMARELRRRSGVSPVHLFVSGKPAPNLRVTASPIHSLPETAFVEELRRLNGTPPQLLANGELMGLVLPALRADFELCETYLYSPESPLGCPITAFGGSEDCEADRPALEAWGPQTAARFSLRLLPGDHFFIHSSEKLLVEEIASRLADGGPHAGIEPCAA